MKHTKRIVTFLLALVMVFTMTAVPTDAMVIKKTSTGLSVAKKMTKNLSDTSAVILWHNMKYKQTKSLNFDKVKDRNLVLEQLHPSENEDLDSSKVSRWFFGPTGKKKLNEDAANLGICSSYYRNLKVYRSGRYYKATATVMLHYGYDSHGKTKYKNIKLGTVTYTYRVRSHTHYGLLLKKATFHRVAKKKYFW